MADYEVMTTETTVTTTTNGSTTTYIIPAAITDTTTTITWSDIKFKKSLQVTPDSTYIEPIDQTHLGKDWVSQIRLRLL